MNDQFLDKQNIAILAKSGCYGCGVCVDVCPVECILFEDDHEGFPYPIVDQEACIDCGMCIDCCPGLNDLNREPYLDAPSFYAGFSLDDQVRHKSSSGGLFSLVADAILARGGVVYGARYDFSRMTVVHDRAEDQESLAALRKSKYVESSSVNIFPLVQRDLLSGKPVLFTGTPCQVAGLHLFLWKEHENLFTCDNICHGVPSPGLFHRHFSVMEAQHGKTITHIDFRTKTKGWKGPLELYLQVDYDGKPSLTYAAFDAYYALFLANLSLRPCCYECKYASIQRQSDLTLGDFWGVKKQHPTLFDGKGTSLILANTQKGLNLLQGMQGLARLEELNRVRPYPPNLARPTPKPKYREHFFNHIKIERWRPQRRWHHLTALTIIVKDKLWGAVAKFFSSAK